MWLPRPEEKENEKKPTKPHSGKTDGKTWGKGKRGMGRGKRNSTKRKRRSSSRKGGGGVIATTKSERVGEAVLV